MRISWKRLAQVAVLVLALGFLVALVRSQWSSLAAYQWQIEPGWALLSLLGLELSWLLELATWRTVLASLGGQLTYRRAVRTWFLSNLIRYIPGNVWQFLGMVEMAAEDGVPRPATLTSIVLHQAISTAAGLVLAALYFAMVPSAQAPWSAWLRPFLLAVPLGLLLLQPRILERVLNWALVKLGRNPLHITLTWGQVWILLLRYGVVWLGMGLSFTALVRSVTPLAMSDVAYLVASWAAAYVIGYLSMLTPSGIGVREGVMVVLLSVIMPGPIAAVVAIVARLWMVVGEILGAGLGLLAGRRAAPGTLPALDGGHATLDEGDLAHE